MARFDERMRGQVAGSMNDRPAPPGSSGAVFPGHKSSMQRQAQGSQRLDSARLIELERIIADTDQPRKEFDPEALDLLAASLKSRGQLQPIRVRWVESADRYVVVVGERRFRAAELAGLKSIACVIVAGDATPEDILEDQLVENALREGLKPIEQANAYQTLMTSRGLTQAQLAERLRISQPAVSKAMALLNLPPEIQAKVDDGSIDPSSGVELSRVADPGEQAELAREAAEGRLRRDEIKGRTRTPRKPSSARAASSRSFATVAGPKVTVEHKGGLEAGSAIAAIREVLAQLETESRRPE
jgi:ParB family chromosome partitioning protein